MKILLRVSLVVGIWAMLSLFVPGEPVAAQDAPAAPANLLIYGDSLAAGWADWSWDTTRNFGATAPVHSGAQSLAVRFDAAWAGLYLHADPAIATAGYTHLRFWLHGGATGGQAIRIVANGSNAATVAVTAPANAWQQFAVPLAELGSPATLVDLYWKDNTGAAQPTFYLDDIELVASVAPPVTAATVVTVTVDFAADHQPISPYIYGLNFADPALADELDLPVNRWGGNATSRYNYLTDIANHAMDWYFENIKESNATTMPGDSLFMRFVRDNRAAGVETLMVVPTSGWVSNAVDRACGFSVEKYGAQTAADPWEPDCGNGVRPGGALVTGNDPADTSIAAPPAFVTGWVAYLRGQFGAADAGGIRFFSLDNEPDIWFETQRDVAPTGWRYQEFRDRTYAYAAAIKAAEPAAQLFGPVVNGWTYYWHGAYDGQRQDWNSPDDRLANGDVPFVPWYLQQMAAYEAQHGVRLLDYLTVHFYPQAAGVALSEAGNAQQQALRLRSTRALWDPTYVDESWIADAGPEGGIVKLIPRLRAWVAANYPGTKLAITEYNWGALDHINGALAQADVLGIFGREGLDLATLWSPPAPGQPGAYAFRMYRNYDGQGRKFGETRVRTVSADQGKVAAYGARRGDDGALTLMLVNKSGAPITTTVMLADFPMTGAVQVYQYGPQHLDAIQRLADAVVSGGRWHALLPADTITLLIVLPEEVAPLPEQQRVYLPTVQAK